MTLTTSRRFHRDWLLGDLHDLADFLFGNFHLLGQHAGVGLEAELLQVLARQAVHLVDTGQHAPLDRSSEFAIICLNSKNTKGDTVNKLPRRPASSDSDGIAHDSARGSQVGSGAFKSAPGRPDENAPALHRIRRLLLWLAALLVLVTLGAFVLALKQPVRLSAGSSAFLLMAAVRWRWALAARCCAATMAGSAGRVLLMNDSPLHGSGR